MSPIEAKMRGWLAAGTDHEKRVARDRIALGFGPEPAPAPAPALPPVAAQLGNAVRAASRVVSAVATGSPVLADDATIAARLAVCNGPPGDPPCDQRTEGGRCAGCGCWVNRKASLATEACPLGRWPEAGP